MRVRITVTVTLNPNMEPERALDDTVHRIDRTLQESDQLDEYEVAYDAYALFGTKMVDGRPTLDSRHPVSSSIQRWLRR